MVVCKTRCHPWGYEMLVSRPKAGNERAPPQATLTACLCVCVCVCLSVFCINILTYCTFNAYCLLLHACSRAVHGFRLKLLSPSLSSLWFYPSSQHDPLHMRPFALHVPGNCAGGGDTKWRRPPFQGHGGEGHPGPHACKCKSLSPQHLRI